ncbi:hypothetical protein VPH35_038600 [Triticum aestivum]
MAAANGMAEFAGLRHNGLKFLLDPVDRSVTALRFVEFAADSSSERVGRAPPDRAPCPNRATPLEETIRRYADKPLENVVKPEIGMSFDSLGEAYDLYNLYSWELGFVGHLGGAADQRDTCNKRKESPTQSMESTGKVNPEAPGWIRSKMGVSMIKKKVESWPCTCSQITMPWGSYSIGRNNQEVHCPLHNHIDVYTKDLVKQLRGNNVNLNKVYNIVGSFFGSSLNVPFTKMSLQNLSTQHSRKLPRFISESAFHKEYMRLQFDRESDESYREKRIQISGAVMRGSIAIEQHANKVYTRKMFEQFGENLFKGRAYQVEEIVKHIARHNDAEKCEKWRVVDYKVTMLDDGEWFECECGQFTHMGMVCCHALKVMGYVVVKEMLKRHILKRWTKDARDILPRHLAHFKRNQVVNKSFTCRSSTLYLHAMELVRLGDSSVMTYELVLGRSKDMIAEAQLSAMRGGADNKNSLTLSVNWDEHAGLSAPSKKCGARRPCISSKKGLHAKTASQTCNLQELWHRRTTCKNCRIAGLRHTSCTRPWALLLLNNLEKHV